MKTHTILFITIVWLFDACTGHPDKQHTSGGIDKKQTTPLHVGSQVPDIPIAQILTEGTVRQANIRDFNDRLLILDFWGTGCKGCIEALPGLASLQNRFGDRVKILPVTYDTRKVVEKFFQKHPDLRELRLPTVVEDQTLKKWFAHRAIPHEVWIYKGKVTAITGPEYINAENIQLILDGAVVDWPEKKDMAGYNPEKPLFTVSAGKESTRNSRLFYSVLSGYREDVQAGSGTFYDPQANTSRVYLTNLSILGVYLIAWNRMDVPVSFPVPNRYLWEVKNPSEYHFRKGDGYRAAWNREHAICYEAVFPDSLSQKALYRKVVEDIDQFFNLSGRWEKRKITCLELIKTGQGDRLKASGGKAEEISLNGPVKKFRNVPLSSLVWLLNEQAENPPVFDESNYTDNVDLDLKITSWTDMPALRRELQAYGLDMKEVKREEYLFVLTEKEGQGKRIKTNER